MYTYTRLTYRSILVFIYEYYSTNIKIILTPFFMQCVRRSQRVIMDAGTAESTAKTRKKRAMETVVAPASAACPRLAVSIQVFTIHS